MALMSPLPTTRPASSVKGFWRETMPRPAREMDMARTRRCLEGRGGGVDQGVLGDGMDSAGERRGRNAWTRSIQENSKQSIPASLHPFPRSQSSRVTTSHHCLHEAKYVSSSIPPSSFQLSHATLMKLGSPHLPGSC